MLIIFQSKVLKVHVQTGHAAEIIIRTTCGQKCIFVLGRHESICILFWRSHKGLISSHILCCFAESSTPINKVKDNIISSGFGSTCRHCFPYWFPYGHLGCYVRRFLSTNSRSIRMCFTKRAHKKNMKQFKKWVPGLKCINSPDNWLVAMWHPTGCQDDL